MAIRPGHRADPRRLVRTGGHTVAAFRAHPAGVARAAPHRHPARRRQGGAHSTQWGALRGSAVRLLALAPMVIVTTMLVAANDAPLPQFVDIARQAGITFHHTNGASPDKHLVETMGSGGLLFDLDDDSLLDVFLVDGGSVTDTTLQQSARHRLFRNSGNGRFMDVTARSGIQHRQYGMGACAGDYDGDGDADL